MRAQICPVAVRRLVPRLMTFVILALAANVGFAQANCEIKDDADYTKQIRANTTAPTFTTELVDHLPWSSCVPAPDVFLHHIIGAPNVLDHVADINAYMRLLESKSPRVKVFSIGKSEEGREMLMVAVSDEENIKNLDRYRQITARLADPRTIKTDDEARALIAEGKPMYWASGSIHSPETGSPEMLMELAYRLAVEETPFIQKIRKDSIVLLTPVTEVDGRDREVDVYMHRKKHPDEPPYPLTWWGHYVSHDNNRDGMQLSLALSRNMMNAFLNWHVTVFHDLHESVPYMYISTGTGPYNPWLDPITVSEWQEMAYYEIQEMTKRGVIGVWTHGFYDGWAPNYMFYLANGHNSIGRFYETFGNGGADTRDRELPAASTSREWYRPNPPLPKVKWSARNNINMQQSGILFGMNNLASNGPQFLWNFYLKSKRAVEKARREGPAAWVFPADDARPAEQAKLLNLLKAQGIEVQRANGPITTKVAVTPWIGVSAPATGDVARASRPRDARSAEDQSNARGEGDNRAQNAGEGARATQTGAGATQTGAGRAGESPASTQTSQGAPRETSITFPAGSYIVRMDQPYSRMADMMLDTEFYNPRDPRSYDDTGWTLGALRNVKTLRVMDASILETPMSKVDGELKPAAAMKGSGPVLLIAHTTDNPLATLRFKMPNVAMEAAEAPFEAAGQKFRAGSVIIRNAGGSSASTQDVQAAARELGLTVTATAAAPDVKTHPLAAPRVAILHDWRATQNDGWFRIAFDGLKIPYSYIADTYVRETPDLRSKYDVIIVPPLGFGGGGLVSILHGLPMRGAPMPWKNTEEMPNLVRPGIDQTDDMRGGLGYSGLPNLEKFVAGGGLLVTVTTSNELAINGGMTDMVSVYDPRTLQAPGDVVLANVDDPKSPIAYGYDDKLYVYFHEGPLVRVGGFGGGGGGRGIETGTAGASRASGRGTTTDPDVIQGRQYTAPEREPRRSPREQELYIPEEAREQARWALPPEDKWPRVVLRYAPERELMLSGMMVGASEVAEKPAIVDVPHGNGHVVLFSNNPMWRDETGGTYFFLLNAIMNWDHLDAGRPAPKPASKATERDQQPLKPE
jgi:hypothetical protein